MLQWGRPPEGAEGSAGSVGLSGSAMLLQWGRPPEGAEGPLALTM